MRIGIDCRMLGPQNAGLGRYVQQLVQHLLELGSEHEFVLFLKKENWDLVSVQDGVEKVLADVRWYGWEEQVKLPGIIKKANVELMHFPHWNVPFFYRGPFVVTIHDLIMYHYPRAAATTLGPVLYKIKDTLHRILLQHVVRKVKVIFATSEFTKQDIVKTLRVPVEKIVVTYQAPFTLQINKKTRKQENKEIKHTSTRDLQVEEWGVLQKRLDIQKPYALYVGNAYPHKNVDGLVRAWEVFEKEHGKDYQLVLVGKESAFYDRVRDGISAGTGIVFTGFLKDEELEHFYTHAELFVFPSLYEGFGLPPLEAMARGIPVVSSNRSCMPEVLGEGALYADPENPNAFAEVMYTGLTDEGVRFDLKELGREEVRRYDWKRLAEETLKKYR